MCPFSQSDFDLNTVGHNGPTVKGVIAVRVCNGQLYMGWGKKSVTGNLKIRMGVSFRVESGLVVSMM